MTLVERIKNIAKTRGLNLKTTALKAGIGENSIYRWKSQTPTSESLQKVANVLNVSVDYLLGNTDDPSPISSDKSDTDPDVVTLQRMAQDYTPEERKRAIRILNLAIKYEKGLDDDDE